MTGSVFIDQIVNLGQTVYNSFYGIWDWLFTPLSIGGADLVESLFGPGIADKITVTPINLILGGITTLIVWKLIALFVP